MKGSEIVRRRKALYGEFLRSQTAFVAAKAAHDKARKDLTAFDARYGKVVAAIGDEPGFIERVFRWL